MEANISENDLRVSKNVRTCRSESKPVSPSKDSCDPGPLKVIVHRTISKDDF